MKDCRDRDPDRQFSYTEGAECSEVQRADGHNRCFLALALWNGLDESPAPDMPIGVVKFAASMAECPS